MQKLVVVLLLGCCLLGNTALAAPFTVKCFTPEAVKWGDVLFAPLQPFAECVGATITTEKNGSTTVTLKGKSFTCTANAKTAKANGAVVALPAVPVGLFKGGLCVPVIPLVKALGGTVTEDQQTVSITLPGLAIPLVLRLSSAWGDSPAGFCDLGGSLLFGENADGTGLRRLTYGNQDNMPGLPSISPDGSLLAYYLRRDSKLVVRPAAGGDVRQVAIVQTGDTGKPFPFSADGKYLYCECGGYTLQVSVADGATRRLCPGETVVPSPDGKHLAAVIEGRSFVNSTLWILNTDGSDRKPLGNGYRPVFSPDGCKLMFTRPSLNNDNRLHEAIALYTVSGEDAGKLNEPPVDENAPNQIGECFTPDGKSIVFTDWSLRSISVMAIDRTGAKKIGVAQNEHGPARDIRISSDGKTLIILRAQGLYCMSIDGGVEKDLAKGMRVDAYNLAPDGTQVLFGATPGEER